MIAFDEWYPEQLRALDSNDSEQDDLDESFTSSNSGRTVPMSELQGASSFRSDINYGSTPPAVDEQEIGARMRWLSIPPCKPFAEASISRVEPLLPVKKGALPNDDYRSELHGKSQPDEHARGISTDRRCWMVRTPSPRGADRDRIVSPGTPPSQRKIASSGLLRSVVASAMRRKEEKRKP